MFKKGNPTIKPAMWGPPNRVAWAVRDYFENKIGLPCCICGYLFSKFDVFNADVFNTSATAKITERQITLGNNNYVTYASSIDSNFNTTGFTVFAVYNQVSHISTTSNRFIDKHTESTENDPTPRSGFSVYYDASNYLNLQIGQSSSWGTNVAASSSLAYGVDHSVIFGFDKTNKYMYSNGELVGQNACSTYYPVNKSFQISNGYGLWVNQYFAGSVKILYIIPKGITAKQAARLHAEPYAAIQPRSFPKYFYVAASGESTLTIQNISQGQSLSNIDLIQQNVLSINAISQSQTVANIDLIQQHIIAIDGISQAQSLENIELIQQSILGINGISQVQNVDSIDLVQQNIVVINNISQAQGIGNVDLVQQHLLSVASISQAQSIDALDLTQNNVLSIQDVTQSQIIDSIELSGAIILEIANVLQAQGLSNTELIQAHILSVAGISQAQSLSNIGLTQQNMLAIQDVAQVQSVQSIVLSTDLILQIADMLQTQSIGSLDVVQANLLNIGNITQTQSVENVTLTQAQVLEINDTLQAQGITNVSLSIPPGLVGKVTVTFSMKVPSTTFSMRKPSATITLQ